MLKKCLIANRGEIAVRIIRACRELGIQTVAVYSEADRASRHVQLADQAILIGAAPPSESYLNIPRLIAAAVDTGCDCVHPGYGFLSENAGFAEAVIGAGLTWIGPDPEAIRLMGVKTQARELMLRANVPLVPGFSSDDAPDQAFLAAAEQIGYPIMVKAAGGGGGKGIRIVRAAADLPEAIAGARREAQKAFGDARVFLERYIDTGRHIEVQVIADRHGNTLHLFERECSTQRRHQKIIEESPSPLLSDAQRHAIGQAAVDAARAVNYVNAGTVEFIATPQGEFFFLEMNTRLQVEHPVTECVTGVDLVKLQFQVASGEPLPFDQADLRQRGHAIECRVYAEDPRNQFLPAIGKVHTFIAPQAPNVRVDTYLKSGDEITIHYDPMIAKIIVYDRTREEAITRMRQALRDTVVLGVTTNLDFLLTLLDHPVFIAGDIDTTFVDTHLHHLLAAETPMDDLALIAVALSDLKAKPITPSAVAGQGEGDSYSPWNRGDHFRMGRH
ncbi:MAG: acetyl-CoA carboxylase biotin carboxylase subunit [Anaerolineae bacterium]|jgi:acetyl-CoA carboxylase biotin carboxylase subunit|nr:acetyl-CoA carboxylase biotin carboxylase subunit [Anaerolineae bacterium]